MSSATDRREHLVRTKAGTYERRTGSWWVDADLRCWHYQSCRRKAFALYFGDDGMTAICRYHFARDERLGVISLGEMVAYDPSQL